MGGNLLAPTLPEFAAVTAGLYTETSLRKQVYHFDLSALVNGVAASIGGCGSQGQAPPPHFSSSLWITSGSCLVLTNLKGAMLSYRHFTLMNTASGPCGFTTTTCKVIKHTVETIKY